MERRLSFISALIITSIMMHVNHTYAEVLQKNKTIQMAPTTASKAKIVEAKIKNAPIKYPQVKDLQNKKAENKINAVLKSGAELANTHRLNLLAEEKKAKQNWNESQGPWRPYEYVFTYKVPYNNQGKLSVIYNEYTYTSGAHGMTIGTTYNFNTRTGGIVPLSSIIKGKEKAIQKYAFEQLQKKYSGYVLIKSPNEINLKDKGRLWVFAQAGIKLIFNEYEVAAYAAGMPEVVIPSNIYKK